MNSSPTTEPTALDSFMRLHAEVADLAAELTASVEDHFGADPDGIGWTDVHNLDYIAGKLRSAARAARLQVRA